MDVVGHTYYPFVDPKRYSKVLEPDNGSIGELLTIDDLLDFSNEDIGGTIGDLSHTTGSSTNSLHESQEFSPNSSSPLEKSISHPDSVILGADGPADLCVPCDDLAELEWLSNFVEESFSSGDVATNVFVQGSGTHDIEQQNKHRVTSKQRLQAAAASSVSILESSACSDKPYGSSFTVEVAGKPARARSKRCRTAVCFWNTCILSADAASILESCSTSTITVAKPLSHDDSASLAHEQAMEMESMRGKKKNLCKASNQYPSKSKKLLQVESATAQARKCLHCATQKTPQWRAGPMGPKTLCNACGVRYKSGRLLPEYRPAASPTFVETLHSNSHRRVLEMRNNTRDSEALLGAHEGALQHSNLLQMQLGDGNDLVNELRDDIALVT